MRIAPVADVKAKLSSYLEMVETNGPIVITRNGKAVAVLLAARDDDALERLLMAHSPRLQAILAKSERSIEEGKGLSRDAFWKAVGKRRIAKKATRSGKGLRPTEGDADGH